LHTSPIKKKKKKWSVPNITTQETQNPTFKFSSHFRRKEASKKAFLILRTALRTLGRADGAVNNKGVRSLANKDLTQNTMATATRTSPNKRFNEQNNGCARAL